MHIYIKYVRLLRSYIFNKKIRRWKGLDDRLDNILKISDGFSGYLNGEKVIDKLFADGLLPSHG